MILVLFATLLVTILLLGPTLDKILLENIRTQVVDEVNESNLKFQNPSARLSYVNSQIAYRITILGLNEPWYSPSKLFFKLISIMTLDLGKSHFFTTDAGSSNVRDIIFEKIPKTLLLFTTSTIMVAVIGILLGASSLLQKRFNLGQDQFDFCHI